MWSPLKNTPNSAGIIAAGCESGHLQLYSASKLLAGEDALVATQDKHTGKHLASRFAKVSHSKCYFFA